MTERTGPTGKDLERERPIDRMREACEKRGVPFKETTREGRRTRIFFGSAAKHR